tara:strand:- start:201 stop:1397 length:1197 start_codon:yes stop_codon:yes gene_type:complete
MSTLKVDAIRHNSATSDAITTAADGTCTAKLTSVGGGQLSNRNLSINGADMMVAQRGTSTTGLQNTGGVYTIDRFAHRRGGTWANALWKDEQVNSGTGLFKKALKKTTTTAEGSAAGTGQYVMIGHYLEASDSITAFGDGTAEAKPFTVSFYVKASIATTYNLHIATSHLSTQKAYMKQFTVNSANTWERKTCTIPALTNSIGTVTGADNGTGLRIHWVLDAPTGSQAADTWYTHTAFDFPSGQSPTGYANTLNATFELGGVQIESGTIATDLEHRSFGDELRRCMRYYEKTYPYGVAPGGSNSYAGFVNQTGSSNTSGTMVVPIQYGVEKRAVPTLTAYNSSNGNSGTWYVLRNGASGHNSVTIDQSSTRRARLYFTTGAAWVVAAAEGHFIADAEL